MAVPGGVRLRSAPELATLLLELGRLIRARRYYPAGDAKLATVFESFDNEPAALASFRAAV